MRFAFFYHSIVSDWNNGNAHFLRGIVTELLSRGHAVTVFEPDNGWSRQNLVRSEGQRPLQVFYKLFSTIKVAFYANDFENLEEVIHGYDVVIVHEWSSIQLVKRIVRQKKEGGDFALLFHDTHHRLFFSPALIDEYELDSFDGVLAFGESLRQFYLRHGISAAWTWHEAADSRIFYPRLADRKKRDLLWIGNGGDGERDKEYEEYLLAPVRELEIEATFYGVRYSPIAMKAFYSAGFRYGGWIANYQVPAAFGSHRMTLHIPRSPYVNVLPGIPSIRVYEALACGIPLICTFWEDSEKLFTPGKDFLMAEDGRQMKRYVHDLLNDSYMSVALSTQGRRTILAHHTCAHRVDELVNILSKLDVSVLNEDAGHSPSKKARKA